MSVTPAPPVWAAGTPDERRRTGVADLVSNVMAAIEGNRYASAYGTLAGLVTSREPRLRDEWAPAFVAELERAMSEHPFDRKGSQS